jgi:hypothetical protein
MPCVTLFSKKKGSRPLPAKRRYRSSVDAVKWKVDSQLDLLDKGLSVGKSFAALFGSTNFLISVLLIP